MRHLGHIIPTLVAGVLVSGAAKGQDLQPQMVSIAKVSQERVLPFEPIVVAINLKNKGQSDEKIQKWSTSRRMPLKFKRDADTDWTIYQTTSPIVESSHSDSRIVSPPGSSVSSVYEIGPNPNGEFPFEHPGTYLLQGAFPGYTHTPATLVVGQPEGEDAAACRYIKSNRIFQLFSHENLLLLWVRKPVNQQNFSNESRQLSDFIDRFPKSKYADWARLARIYLMEIPSEASYRLGSVTKSPSGLRQAQQELYLLSQKTRSPVAITALFECGAISLYLGESEPAERYFRMAREKGQFATLPEQILDIKNLFVEFPWIVGTPKPSTPRDVFEQTIDTLNREGYDVANFSRDYPKQNKAYMAAVTDLLDARQGGHITEKEYYERLSALLNKTMRAVVPKGKL